MTLLRRRTGVLASACALVLALLVGPLFSQQASMEPVRSGGEDVPEAKADDGTANGETDADSEAGEETLPKIEDMELPTVEELVKGPPLDWVVLRNDDVLVVQPVFPRPDTLARIRERLETDLPKSPRTPDERSAWVKRRRELDSLVVRLPGDDVTEYRLPTNRVDRVVHHEDLVLARVRRLIGAGELRGAYELLFPLSRRFPDWPMLADVEWELLLAQANRRHAEGRLEEALAYFEELLDRDPSSESVRDRLASTMDALLAESVENADFRRAQFLVRRLAERLPNDDVLEKWVTDLERRARELMPGVLEARADGAHDVAATLADRAARVWPATKGLRQLHRTAGNRWQRLRVAVRGRGVEATSLPVATASRRRHLRLVTAPLFEIAGIDHRAAYRHREVASWFPTALGRRITINLRRDRETWESSTVLTSSEVAAAIRAGITNGNERLAGLVESVRVSSPFQFEVGLRSAALRPESLLAVPTGEPGVPRGRFVLHEVTDDVVSYRRSIPEPDGQRPTEYHVAEIRERRYHTWDRALQGLLREEVDLVTRVAPRHVAVLDEDVRFEVRRYALPRTHVLRFNVESPPFRSQSLRRSLAYATDAERVLREVVVGSEHAEFARLVSAPWPRSTPFYDRTVAPYGHDFGLAVALRLAATKELRALPELRMLVVGDENALAAAEEVALDWRRVGFRVRVLAEEEYLAAESPRWDVLYDTVSMAEPLTELWPFLAVRPAARVEDLRDFPDWLRADLLALERVTNWADAETRLRRLQADLLDDVRYLPLFEVDEHFVLRTTLRPATRRDVAVVSPYSDVERWIVRPSYPSEAE